MYCKNCGAELPRNAVECSGCGTRVGTTVASIACPACGYVAMAPTAFCEDCGASLQEQLGRSGPVESSISTPSPSAGAIVAAGADIAVYVGDPWGRIHTNQCLRHPRQGLRCSVKVKMLLRGYVSLGLCALPGRPASR
jgi:hypothetical protein